MPIYKRQYKGKTQYRFKVYYKDSKGDRKQKCSKWYMKAKDAKKAEDLFVLKSSQEQTNQSRTKFETVALDWIEYTSINNTTQTTRDKHTILNKYWIDLHNMDIHSIRPAKIKSIIESPLFQRLSTKRKNKALDQCKSIFSHAMIFYGLKENPMQHIPRFKATQEEQMREMNIYTPEQFQAFYEAIRPEKQEIADYFYILFWTGLRKNELRSVTFSCFNGKSLNIKRQWKDGHFEPLKTRGSVRKVTLDKDCLDIIENQYNRYKDQPGFNAEWFIFGGYKPIPKTNIDREKVRTIKEHNLPDIRIHDFRHSHVSYLIEMGVNIYKISKRLGHSSIEMTINRYGHLIDTEEEEIILAINQKNQKNKAQLRHN